ncbi:hypothetical protein K1719_024640 [Acacia pycnantha]|nr:hypothetical protein K1719_024640 [Acacia pycnantha]
MLTFKFVVQYGEKSLPFQLDMGPPHITKIPYCPQMFYCYGDSYLALDKGRRFKCRSGEENQREGERRSEYQSVPIIRSNNIIIMDPSSAILDSTKSFCGFLNNEASYAYNLEGNLTLLETEWKKLQDKKKDVEEYLEVEENTGEIQRSRQVSDWLESLESVQKEITVIQVRRNKQIEKKCLSIYCPKYCISSYKLGKNVAEILGKVDGLETEWEKLIMAFKRLHKSSEMPCGETVGLDLMIRKVLESIEDENVGIVGIYGMGGAGKTTLLKKINNELVKRSDFYIVWVVVSKSLNLDKIMDDIRKSVGIGDEIWNRCSNQDGKAAKIYEALKKKKFVLLLDDIWDMLDLEKVGVPHPKETSFQSKVLLTTRFEDVCEKMKAKKFKVEVLTEKQALELFCMKVGEETLKSNPVICNIAQEMARKCKGLPLALSVVGSAMAGVKRVDAWEHSINNLTHSSMAASNLETEVFSVLKFSYDRLPDETHKKCFLYCALYPEDDDIEEYDLIGKWMGEGFLDIDGMKSVHDMHCHGGSIIEKLKLSCLLENVEHEFSFRPLVKMHDVMRDMALWIARDQDRNKKKIIVQEDARAISQANVENWEMVERISILNADESWIQIKSWTSLRTLLLEFNFNCAINGLQNIQYASQLKALGLKSEEIVSAEGIGGLNLLEYLSLEVSTLTNASDLWRELKNLKNLKFFHLFVYDDRGVIIPLGLVSNLHQLKVFRFHVAEVRDEKEEEEFVEELECSSNLEELWADITTESGLIKLLKLVKLQSCIYFLWLHDVGGQVNGPLLLATMSKMKHLHRLALCDLKNVIDLSVCGTCRLSALQIVSIFYCDSIHHLTWLKYAPLLRELDVESCWSIEEVIKGEIVLEEDEKDTIFPSLEVLTLDGLPNLRSIYERVLSFPSLRSIEVSDCENLKKLPFDSNSAKAKLRRIRGDQEWWDNLEWDDPGTKATFHSKFQHR